jgi:hypothetical protein
MTLKRVGRKWAAGADTSYRMVRFHHHFLKEETMHEDYEDYDEDEYDNPKDKYKHYFKFDPEAWDAWGKMLFNTLNGIVEDSNNNVWYVANFSNQFVPVNSYFPNTGQSKNFQCLGNNYQDAKIWKTKYFVSDNISSLYFSHIQSHAIHFITQPTYYKGLFDILN